MQWARAAAIWAATAACATSASEEGLRARLERRLGTQADDVVRDLGAPASSVSLSGGNQILTWNLRGEPSARQSACLIAASGAAGMARDDRQVDRLGNTQWACSVRLEVDHVTLNVVRYWYSGNGCNAPPPATPVVAAK